MVINRRNLNADDRIGTDAEPNEPAYLDDTVESGSTLNRTGADTSRTLAEGSNPVTPGGDPRAVLVAQLAGAVASLTASGDIEGARVATDAIARLLASPGSGSAAVVDLAERRRRR